MAEYYSGTVYVWDEDDNASEHKVIWASHEQGKPHPPEWFLMEVDGEEEHFCNPELWRYCVEAFEKTHLSICYD